MDNINWRAIGAFIAVLSLAVTSVAGYYSGRTATYEELHRLKPRVSHIQEELVSNHKEIARIKNTAHILESTLKNDISGIKESLAGIRVSVSNLEKSYDQNLEILKLLMRQMGAQALLPSYERVSQ